MKRTLLVRLIEFDQSLEVAENWAEAIGTSRKLHQPLHHTVREGGSLHGMSYRELRSHAGKPPFSIILPSAETSQ